MNNKIKEVVLLIHTKLGNIDGFEYIKHPTDSDLDARYYCNGVGDYWTIKFGTVEVTWHHEGNVLIEQDLDNYISLEAIFDYLVDIKRNITEENMAKVKEIRAAKIAELEKKLEGLKK